MIKKCLFRSLEISYSVQQVHPHNIVNNLNGTEELNGGPNNNYKLHFFVKNKTAWKNNHQFLLSFTLKIFQAFTKYKTGNWFRVLCGASFHAPLSCLSPNCHINGALCCR